MKKSALFIALCMVYACAGREIEPASVDTSSRDRAVSAVVKGGATINLSGGLRRANLGASDGNQRLVEEYKQEYHTVDTETKCDLLVAIAELDKINTVDFFIQALSDPEPRIRQEAAIQMKQMVLHPGAREALISALDDSNDNVLIEVIEAVSDVNDRRIINKLKEIAASHSDSLIRGVASDYARKLEGYE